MTIKTQQLDTKKIPELRFPGFDGEWEKKKLESCLIKHDEKTIKNKQYPVLTSSQKGIFFQKDYFAGKDVASSDTTGYNVVPRNFFTYRHMSDTLVFKFNINNIVDKGIVSTLYPVFTTKGIIDNFLLLKLNEGVEFKKYAILQKQGGSRTYMYFSKLRNLYLNLPCLKEQQKIADFLGSVNEWIENLRAQKEALEKYKKGMMQKIFSQEIRFKDDDGKDFPDWEEKRLGEVVSFWNGKAHEQDISENGKYIVVNSKFISRNGEVKKYSDKQMSPLKKDDIVIVMSDVPNGKAIGKCFLVDRDNKYSLNQRIGGIRSNEIISSFLFRVINRNKYFLKFNNGVSQTNLRRNEILRCPVKFPVKKEQQKITDFLSEIDDLIQQKDNEMKMAREWKKGLMQQLFV